MAFAALDLKGYTRHLNSGDQAGFALGELFLVTWFLPIAAVMLVAGSILFVPLRTAYENRLLRWSVLSALIAGAVFFLAYAAWVALTLGPDSLFGGPYTAVFVAFAANVIVCAIAVRSDSTSPGGDTPRRVSRAILAASAILVVPMAASVPRGILVQGRKAMILLFMTWPLVMWFLVLLWSVWRLRGRRTTVPLSLSGSREV